MNAATWLLHALGLTIVGSGWLVFALGLIVIAVVAAYATTALFDDDPHAPPRRLPAAVVATLGTLPLIALLVLVLS